MTDHSGKVPSALSRLVPLALAAALSGCATFDHSLVDMAVAHNRTLDRVDRDVALLNLLRAADDQPLTFTVVSYVSGNASVGGSAGFGETRDRYFGPLVSGGVNSNLSLNASRGYSFSLGPLDNEQFMRAFLGELSLDKLLYIVEGTSLPPEVAWTLAAYSLTFQGSDGSRTVYTSEPTPTEWGPFQAVLARAIRQGLSVEERAFEVPVGPALSRDEALSQLGTVVASWNNASSAGGAAKPMLAETGNADPARRYQMIMVSNKVGVCLDPPNLKSWFGNPSQLCKSKGTKRAYDAMRLAEGSSSPARAADTSVLWDGIGLRSPREIYYLLGKVLRAQLERPGEVLLVGDAQQWPEQKPKPLIRVICDSAPTGGEPLARASYRGKECHVPRDDDSHSSQVLQALSLLVTLSKVQGAVPTAPTILVR